MNLVSFVDMQGKEHPCVVVSVNDDGTSNVFVFDTIQYLTNIPDHEVTINGETVVINLNCVKSA